MSTVRPGRTVALGMLLIALVWLGLLGATGLSPPTDCIEQITWVRSLEWGYYKTIPNRIVCRIHEGPAKTLITSRTWHRSA